MVGRNRTHRYSLTVRSRLFAREVTIGLANLLSGSSCGLYWRRAFCPSPSKNAGSPWRATERAGRQYLQRTRTRGRGGGWATSTWKVERRLSLDADRNNWGCATSRAFSRSGFHRDSRAESFITTAQCAPSPRQTHCATILWPCGVI